MDGSGAERSGKRLLKEVETEGLGEILSSLRDLLLSADEKKIFSIPELDGLLSRPRPPAPVSPAQQHQRSDDELWEPDQQTSHAQRQATSVLKKEKKITGPVLELVSPPHTYHASPAGKTSLIYSITTHAILPPTLSNIALSGHNGLVILFDPLHHFSVSRLTRLLIKHIVSTFTTAGLDTTNADTANDIKQCVKHSLAHVHIFQPSSWESLIATLRGMEEYLFDDTKHASTHRHVHSLILEDIDAFIPAMRNAPAPTSTHSLASTNPLPPASAQLTLHLERLSTRLSCAVVVTSHSATPTSFRPPLPVSWPPGMQTTRLAVRRVEVLKFAPGISVEQAEQKRAQRWEVVRRGRFEAWKVGQGRDGEGFVFRVGDGVEIDGGEKG